MADESTYYIRVRGRVSGPFDIGTLQSQVRRGTLSRIHELSVDKIRWAQASSVDAVFPARQEIVAIAKPAIEPVVEASSEDSLQSDNGYEVYQPAPTAFDTEPDQHVNVRRTASSTCPYCGEPIRPGAEKCRFCNEWLISLPPSGNRLAVPRGRPVQGEEPRSYLNSAILTLVLYFVFYIIGLVANFLYLNSAKKEEARTGMQPEGKQFLVILLWVFFVVPLIVAVAIVAIVVIAGIAGH